MLVVFANNQTLVADASSTVTITTDPVAVGRNNRATGVTNVHSMFNAGTSGLMWHMEISMDGQTWVTQGPSQAAKTSAGDELATQSTVTGVYARLSISYQASASGIGATTFDIHVNFDET